MEERAGIVTSARRFVRGLRTAHRLGRMRRASAKHVLRVTGLRRSGNHAILDWVMRSLGGPCLLLNNCRGGVPLLNAYTSVDGRRGSAGGRRVVVVSFEDRPLEEVYARATTSSIDAGVGVGTRLDINILRDPFNLFASRFLGLRFRPAMMKRGRRTQLIERWKSHAREHLAETRSAEWPMVPIRYNNWVSSREYRDDLARHVGGRAASALPADVSRFGGGSSFHSTSVEDLTGDDGVLDRWRRVGAVPEFWSIFDDIELLRLSDALFPRPEGLDAEMTRQLRGGCAD